MCAVDNRTIPKIQSVSTASATLIHTIGLYYCSTLSLIAVDLFQLWIQKCRGPMRQLFTETFSLTEESCHPFTAVGPFGTAKREETPATNLTINYP